MEVRSRSVKAEFPRAVISSGPCPLGLPNSRCVSLACRWSSSARAGVRPLSATTIPRGAGWNAPRVAHLMRLIAAWHSPSIPFCHSSEFGGAEQGAPHYRQMEVLGRCWGDSMAAHKSSEPGLSLSRSVEAATLILSEDDHEG